RRFKKGPDLDGTRINQLFDKAAIRRDDDRPQAVAAPAATDGIEPRDASLFHVTEIHRVIDVAHGIHVTPANRNVLYVHQFSWFVHGRRTGNPGFLRSGDY